MLNVLGEACLATCRVEVHPKMAEKVAYYCAIDGDEEYELRAKCTPGEIRDSLETEEEDCTQVKILCEKNVSHSSV